MSPHPTLDPTDSAPSPAPAQTLSGTARFPILIADDEEVARELLGSLLTKWGYQVTVATTGREAWEHLERTASPCIAILDWLMPDLTGPEVCARVRERFGEERVYIIMLTSLRSQTDIVRGLGAGANDFISKPFAPAELQARINVGLRLLNTQAALATRVSELEDALNQIRELRQLLPICMYCKKIRDEQDYWHRLESYLSARADLVFSHGICPDCFTDVAAKFHLDVSELEEEAKNQDSP